MRAVHLMLCGLLIGCGAGRGGQPLSAQPWNADEGCWEATVDLSADWSNSDGGCDDVLTLQSGPAGECWRFPSSCVPEEDVWASGCEDSDVDESAPNCE